MAQAKTKKRRSVERSFDPAVRQRIVAAARQYFFTHGFRRVTMDDIAEELGISKKTLYTCFTSKLSLLTAVLDNKLDEVEAGCEKAVEGCNTDFRNSLQSLLQFIRSQTQEIQPPMIRDMQRELPEVFQRVERRRSEIIGKNFGKLFAEGRKTGILRSEIPAALAVEAMLASVNAVMNPATMNRLGMVPKTAFTAIISLLLEGLMTEDARGDL